MDKTDDCPLCLEAFDYDDKNFYPCACGYQVCRFCWHRIRTNENGLCPACRRIYSENPANFQPLTQEEMQKVKQQKKLKDLQKKQKVAENKKQLANIRVIQKNLVFAVGLPLELSQDNQKKEKVLQMFKQYGVTHKEAITDRTTYAGSQGPSACVYITYQKAEDAVRAVKSLANTKIDGRTIKVSLGTTKYCSNFLKSVHCPKPECLYLHEIADEEASFTKEDIHLGKHLEYEQKLLEETLTALQNKTHSNSNETNRTNYNRNGDNSSESSDDVPQNNCFYDSSEAELSPSSNSQNLENNRSIEADLNLETENNHQNLHTTNSESRNNPDTSSNPICRADGNILRSDGNILSNHSSNSNFQDSSLNSVNQDFSNQMLPKETESLQQPNYLHNQIYESTIQSRGQSSSSLNESSFLNKFISSASSGTTNSKLFTNILNMRQEQIEPQHRLKEDYTGLATNSFSNILNLRQEQIEPQLTQKQDYPDLATRSFSNILNISQEQRLKAELALKKDYPDLEFDPCQYSLNGLDALLIEELKEKEKPPGNLCDKSDTSNTAEQSPTLPVQPSDGGLRNTFTHPVKARDPPPGFPNNYPQNVYYKPPYETANAVLNKAPQVMHNQLGIRENYPIQRYQQPNVSLNNSSFSGFSSQQQLSREVPDLNPSIMQQHNQRYMNVPQAQFPVNEQRPSSSWNNVIQPQWRSENGYFNHSIPESQASLEYLRMQQMRSNEVSSYRQQWHQLNLGAHNVSPVVPDLPQPMTAEQVAAIQNMMKTFESQKNYGGMRNFGMGNSTIGNSTMGNSTMGTSTMGNMAHRLQYTKKL